MEMGKKINILFASAFLGCSLGCSVAKGAEEFQNPAESDAAYMGLADDEKELINAILVGDLEGIRFYLEAGIDPNMIVDPSGNFNLLMWLILKCPQTLTVEVLQLLTSNENFNPDFRNRFGDTAAHMCAKTGLPSVLLFLLDLPNFNTNAKGPDGTIMHLLAMRAIFWPNLGIWKSSIEKILRNPDWNSEEKDEEERSVADILIIQKLSRFPLSRMGHINAMVSDDLFGPEANNIRRQNIIALLQSINEAKAGKLAPTPEMKLRDVIMGGNAEEVQGWLTENEDQVDVNWMDPTNRNRSLLMYAVTTGEVEIVRVILNLPGINLAATDSNGCTAFFYAEANRNPSIIKLFQPQEDLPSEVDQ
jgi:ankyrin repeat protein